MLLVVVRVAIPLAVLAAAGRDLPGLPPYDYRPLIGDATGFYAESRELISVSFGPAGVAALLLLVAGAVAVRRLRRSWAAIPAACLAVSLAASALVLDQQTSGAAVVGWPLLWSIPLFPFRLVGLLDEDVAFAVGLVLSLAANAVTVVATAYIGLRATGSRAVGVAAAALFTVWPLLTRPLAGTSAWENGQWLVDVGLALYTEPLSTALVAAAIALLLARALDPVRLASAGALLGFATVVRPSNGFFAVAAVGLLALRVGLRRTVPAALAGLAFAPLVAVYWPKGYPKIENSTRLLACTGGSELGRLVALRPADGADSAPARPARPRGDCALERRSARRRDRGERRPLHVLRAHAPPSALPLRRPAGPVHPRGGRSLVSDS